MNSLSKILVTVAVVFLFIIFFAFLVGGRDATGHQTPGILGIILLLAAYYAIRAIWKKNNNKNEDKNSDDNDSPILQK